ncbi:MAG: Fe-S cluster assembly protein SufB [Candidatus Gracilibacteria bacterium]|jgi:Fe-S cluster assembly protein SufB|nr:Fe-S cluster assembly protein SufB [Candidatus Gracilibacteria bacterium]
MQNNIIKKKLNESLVKEISKVKQEPAWMLEFRLTALEIFFQKSMPSFGPDLKDLNFENINYYIRPDDKTHASWEEVPSEIKDTFDKLGVPQSERKFLAGTGAQFESEMVYHSLKEQLKEQGVIFESIEDGLKNHEELFRKHFAKVIPASDNKFSALNSALWSGGSFIYIPKNTKLDLPLSAYFRMNTENLGQFERTLIITDENSYLHYIEGCTAPVYTTDSLHAAVVEIIAKENSRMEYTTLQNWSKNVLNLVTKRAHVKKNAEMFWLDVNLGSKTTMKYPAIYLMEEGAKGETQSLAFADKGQNIDAGAKIFHMAKNTSSLVLSKSVSKNGGISTYRGITKISEKAKNSKAKITCDALILDDKSISNTYPVNDINDPDTNFEHEARVSKLSEEKMHYLMARGLSEKEAGTMLINGFADPITRQLPMEYAIELNRLIELYLN